MKLQDSHLSCLLLERTSINNCWILLRDKERSFKKNKNKKQKQNDYSCRQIWFKKNKTIPKIIPDSGVKKEKIIRVYTLSKCPDFMCLNVSLKWIYCNDVQTISTHTHYNHTGGAMLSNLVHFTVLYGQLCLQHKPQSTEATLNALKSHFYLNITY